MKKTTKARKYNSPKLQALMDEITPTEMEKTKVKMKLAARIEDIMCSKGWNKTEFANRVGKNPSEITKWFSGTQNFTIDVLTEIAVVFGIDVSALFGKRQVQVIYRTEIVVQAIVLQSVYQPATPTEEPIDIINGRFSEVGQKTFLPLTYQFQA